MQNRRFIIALFSLWALWLPAAWAVHVPGLYEARVVVASQSAAERERAVRAGLRRVIARVAGLVDGQSGEALQEIISGASASLQQYRYDVAAEGPRAGEITLWMLFDAASIENLLADRGIPSWGDERPETLVWLAVDDGGRRLLSADAVGELRDAVDLAARTNGLPLILPILDLEERSQIGFADVWGGFRERVLKASERYAAKSILIGRLARDGVGWRVRWTHVLPGDEAQQEAFENTVEASLDDGVALALRRLSGRFASIGARDAQRAVRLDVDGVDSLEDYARVTRYLSRMPLLAGWLLASVEGASLHIDAQIKGAPGSFARAVTLGNVLVQAAGQNEPMRFQLIK